jgi:endonuclease-3 related protein
MQFAARVPALEPAEALRRYCQTLFQHFGAQRWWPARTRLEVILGAILTQNTAWRNAALAIKQLRKAGLLNLRKLEKVSRTDLESSIRPAGFFRQKAATVRNFLQGLRRAHNGSLNAMFATPPEELRRELLEVRGLGPETVDAILLYAGRHPYFVADAYTRRILERHELVDPRVSYSAAQDFLHQHLPREQGLYNEFHALLVEIGKRYCRRGTPRCDVCPLRQFLPPETESKVATTASLTLPSETRRSRVEFRAAPI